MGDAAVDMLVALMGEMMAMGEGFDVWRMTGPQACLPPDNPCTPYKPVHSNNDKGGDGESMATR